MRCGQRPLIKSKGIEIVLGVGQVAASDVELAEYLGCNRKTIGKLIDSFNSLGMLTTRANNRTSYIPCIFLTGWYVGGVLLTNPHYIRPSANVKEHTEGRRTPSSDERSLEDSKVFCADDNRQTTKADSTESGGKPLFLPSVRLWSSGRQTDRQDDEGNTDHLHIIDIGEAMPDDNGEAEAPKEAQDGTIGDEDSPTQARKIDGHRGRISNEPPLSWRE